MAPTGLLKRFITVDFHPLLRSAVPFSAHPRIGLEHEEEFRKKCNLR